MKKRNDRRKNRIPVSAPPQPEAISAEIVAVIAAAVAAITGGLATIAAIRKQKTGAGHRQPIWRMAGLLENTKPF